MVFLPSASLIHWSIIIVIKATSTTASTVVALVREGEATTGLVPHCLGGSVKDNALEFRS